MLILCHVMLLSLKELLMSGLPEIDPNDWQANTEYSGEDYNEDHPVIKVNALLEVYGNLLPTHRSLKVFS